MTRLPIINFRTMERLLFRLGFERIRQKGSHIFYRHADGRRTTVPHHSGRDLARPLIRNIIRDIDLTPEEFREELEKIVDQVITEVGATTIKDMGKVIKATADKTDGAADNKTISEIVKSKLG